MWALRSRGIRGRWLPLAAVALAFAAGAARAATKAASARIGRCETASLTLTRVRFGTAGSFHEYLDLALVHPGSKPCTLRGYPRLQFRRTSGATLNVPLSHARSDAVRTITLQRDERATFTLHYLGGGPCSRRMTASEILVTPPGDHGSLRLAQQLDMCSPADATLDPVVAPASHPAPSPKLLRADYTSAFAVRPATITFGAGAGFFITGPGVTAPAFRSRHYGHIRWSVWNASDASGTGLGWLDDCTPNCAQGTYRPHPVSLSADRVRKGRYTRLTLDYRFNGHAVHTVASLKRITARNYIWG